MPSIEAYIGSPVYSKEDGSWNLPFDATLKTHFKSMCALLGTVCEATSCTLYAGFPQAAIALARSGDPSDLSDSEVEELRAVKMLTETTIIAEHGNAQRIVMPIQMPSGLAFGWLVVVRPGTTSLIEKERTVLELLHRDICNHLLQNKQAFDAARASGLQTLITEQNEDWIFVKDEDYRIVYANNAFLEVYPESIRDRVIGYTTVEEYDEAEAAVFLAQDKIAFDTGSSKVIEDLHMPDGRQVIVEAVKRRFEDENGKAYILGICRDITTREDLIRELRDANEQLGYFTGVASHDLKSPLNAIRRLLEWIEEDCRPLLPREHIENMRLVINRADRMQALLDDLLTYARVGTEEAVANDVNLRALYEDITQLLDIPEHFVVHVPDATIRVEEVPFKTVMLNLISNAIKHNDKDHGVIDVTVSDSLHYYLIDVKDNGPGIAPEYFQRIFQLFQTLRPRDEVEGSGVGLSVVMKYVKNFGGRVEVSSDGKTGSTFKLMWPKKSTRGKRMNLQ